MSNLNTSCQIYYKPSGKVHESLTPMWAANVMHIMLKYNKGMLEYQADIIASRTF